MVALTHNRACQAVSLTRLIICRVGDHPGLQIQI